MEDQKFAALALVAEEDEMPLPPGWRSGAIHVGP
jgi:hypothetical protein